MFSPISKLLARLGFGIRQRRVRGRIEATSKEFNEALSALAAQPLPEREAAAQRIDEAMRGDPFWEAARAAVIAREKAATPNNLDHQV